MVTRCQGDPIDDSNTLWSNVNDYFTTRSEPLKTPLNLHMKFPEQNGQNYGVFLSKSAEN